MRNNQFLNSTSRPSSWICYWKCTVIPCDRVSLEKSNSFLTEVNNILAFHLGTLLMIYGILEYIIPNNLLSFMLVRKRSYPSTYHIPEMIDWRKIERTRRPMRWNTKLSSPWICCIANVSRTFKCIFGHSICLEVVLKSSTT